MTSVRTRRIVATLAVVVLWLSALYVVDRGSQDSPAYQIPRAGNEIWDREQLYLNFSNLARIGSDPFSIRQTPVAPHPNPNAIRVLAVGDSATWGYGSRNLSTRWWELLELELDRRTDAGTFNVTAAAQPGASIYSFVDWLSPEKIAKTDPDAIVVLVNLNDAVPLGDERMICPTGGCGDYPTLERNVEYMECVMANASIEPAGRPAYTAACAKEVRAKYGDDLLSETDIMNTVDGPLAPMYHEAMRRLFAAANGRPIVVLPAFSNVTSMDSYESTLQEWAQAGAVVADTRAIRAQLANDAESPGWWVHPLDAHPGYLATTSIAVDGAEAVLQTLPADRLTEAGATATPRPERLVDNFLPVHADVTADGSRVTVDAAPWPTEPLPADRQALPCADIVRPHVRLMFDRRLPNGTPLRVTVQQSPDLVVYSAGYRDGIDVYRRIATVAQGGVLDIVLAGDDLRGLLFAPSDLDSCSLDRLELPSRIRLSISRR